jgi:hypothetical protein
MSLTTYFPALDTAQHDSNIYILYLCNLEMNQNHAIHDDYSMVVARILSGWSASSLVLGSRGAEHKKVGSSLANLDFFSSFFNLKTRPKNQNIKLQKRYLDVSKSTGKEVRAFFRFTDKQKNK